MQFHKQRDAASLNPTVERLFCVVWFSVDCLNSIGRHFGINQQLKV